MPKRDSTISIDFDDLPQMQAERRQGDRGQAGKGQTSVAQRPAKSMQAVFLAVILILGALVAVGVFQLHSQTVQLESARDRIAELEKRLSTTDESVTRSGVALQVTIKDIQARQQELTAEMDKLWASAWRRNQSEINDQGNKIKSLSATQGKNRTDIDQINRIASALKADISALQSRIENLPSLEKNVRSHERSIPELKAKIEALERSNSDLRKQVADSAGWIESNNVFRQQTNKSISRLEQQLKLLQPPSAP